MGQKVSFSKEHDIVFNLLERYSKNEKVDQKCQTAYPRFWDFSEKFLKTFFSTLGNLTYITIFFDLYHKKFHLYH